MSGHAHVGNGSFAIVSSQQEVQPCPLCPESRSNFRALAAPGRPLWVDGTTS
jgi:hypothetical protein